MTNVGTIHEGEGCSILLCSDRLWKFFSNEIERIDTLKYDDSKIRIRVRQIVHLVWSWGIFGKRPLGASEIMQTSWFQANFAAYLSHWPTRTNLFNWHTFNRLQKQTDWSVKLFIVDSALKNSLAMTSAATIFVVDCVA